MVRAFGARPREGIDLGVGDHVRPGPQLPAAERVERMLRQDLARQTDGGAHLGSIAFGLQVVELDRGVLARIR